MFNVGLDTNGDDCTGALGDDCTGALGLNDDDCLNLFRSSIAFNASFISF